VVRAFARATGETNPVYFDVEAARAAGHPDLPCPPGFLGRYVHIPGRFHSTFSSPTEEHTLPLGDLPNELHASTRIRAFCRIHAGEKLSVTSRITGMSERQGRIGRMLLVDTLATYRDEKGDVVAEKYNTEIYYRA
jgi:hypothetical protein